MSFTKLLASGRSLIGMKDQDCPYRMRRQNLLPRFESSKNPFAVPAKTPPASVETTPSPAVATVPGQVGAMETSLLFDAQLKPVVKRVVEPAVAAAMQPESELSSLKAGKPAPVSTAAMKVAPKPASPVMELPAISAKPAVGTQHAIRKLPTPAAAAKPVVFPAWMKHLNPLAYLPARHSDRAARTKTGPVQSELSLEKVIVVRNDLSDTDLELVAVPAAGKAATRRKVSPRERTVPTTLTRLTARFFGAGQPQV